ncbi:phage major capsid protein [Acinetobacter variabilis]|uniref:phage major capsid protein n=1 Tax=Acinetobacter variabilis TaxID=70346 RepID=UPI0028AFF3A2|nr:phage major capsid protein [Acinetobacter variabilis]
MTDLAVIEKAIESQQAEIKKAFDAQREEIQKTGEVNKALQTDIAKLNEELQKSGARMFDLEQKLGNRTPEDQLQKSFAEKTAEEITKSWDGRASKAEVGSFYKAITSATASAGDTVAVQRLGGIVTPGLQRLTVRDLLAQGSTSSNAIEYVRENVFTNAADVVAEGTLKPESDITFTKETANVKTIAHWIQASRQIVSDSSQLQSYINNRLMHGLALKEEAQLLNGNGTGDNLTGLNTVATAYNTALTATGDTFADVVAHAVYQVSTSEFEASAVILNPADWHKIALMKDQEGRYIFGGPQAFASKVMWGLPVVTTMSQAANTFTVGAFNLASQVWDNMDATVEVSNQDRDNFVKNMLTILCEERLAVAHYRPQAIIKGTFPAAGG